MVLEPQQMILHDANETVNLPLQFGEQLLPSGRQILRRPHEEHAEREAGHDQADNGGQQQHDHFASHVG